MILFRGGAISGDDNVQNMTMEVGGFSELQKKPIMEMIKQGNRQGYSFDRVISMGM